MSNLIDITGNKYGHLTVVRRGHDLIKKNGKKEPRWVCLCDCGNPNEVEVLGYNLKNGNSVSCGCLRKENVSKLKSFDLIGQRFGHLIVLKRDISKKAKNAYWICQCDCGNIISVNGSNLKRECTTSCGCYKTSKGENKIKDILNELNIQYETQKQFPDLLGTNNGKLRFDFYLPQYNIILEYQGKQHYDAIDYWGGQKGLQERQENDELKRQYCIKRQFKMIEIPYWDYNKLDKDYLKNLF